MVAIRPLLGCALIVCLVAVGCRGSSSTSTPPPGGVAAPTATVVTPEGPGLTPASVPTKTRSGSRPVSISMVSTSTEVQPGQEFTLDLTLDTQGRGISGVQVRIEYDPAVYRAIGMEHGGLLGPDPIEAGPIIDGTTGVLEYAAARIGPTQPPTPSGLFATVKFQVLEAAPAGLESPLRITEVKIPDENIREIADLLIGDELKLRISP